MQLSTIQIAQHRLLKDTGIEFIDTSVKTGNNSIFAPTWAMVTGYKNGTISKAEYTDQYRARMVSSWQTNRTLWKEVIAKEKVAIGCYCAPGEFCHRLLLKDILEEICRHGSKAFVYKGEITKNNPPLI